MKFAKSILLASATAFVSFAASAADLPKKSAPAPVCGFGAGFMMLPGTDTCLKIGGGVQVFGYAHTSNAAGAVGGGVLANQTAFSSRVRFQLSADARTNTSMGVLRSYVEMRMIRDNATGHLGGAGTSSANNYAAAHSTVATMQAAYIQFAGMTAGYAANPFSFGGWHSNAIANFFAPSYQQGVNQLAYTAALGSGLTATLAIVDSNYTRVGNEALPLPVAVAGGAVQYSGRQTPDVVANVNLTQSWGSAQVMGAYHNVGNQAFSSAGYAVGAGVLINLPMLGKGDSLFLNANYAKGAVSYLRDAGNRDNLYTNNSAAAYGYDATYNATLTGLNLSTGYSLYASMRHFWNAGLYSSLYGSYAKYDVAPAVSTKLWSVGTNLTWTPVRALDFSLEATYSRQNATVAGVTGADTNGLWTGLRINRGF